MVSVFSRSEQCTDQPRNERATQPHQGKKQQRGIKAIRGKSVENRTMMAVSEATVKRAFSIAPMIAPQDDDLAKNLEHILLNYGSKLRFANAPYSSKSL